MYTHIVEALPNETAEEIEDLLEQLHTEKQFNVLKEANLLWLERSDDEKLRELHNNASMGDMTPSQLLQFMKSFLTSRHMDEDIMYQLCFEKLPQSMTLKPNGLRKFLFGKGRQTRKDVWIKKKTIKKEKFFLFTKKRKYIW